MNRRSQFEDIYQRGVTVDTASFRLVYRENRRSCSRFAAVVSKRFGSAVRRNKAKRIARKIFHEFQRRPRPPCDIILFPKKEMLVHGYPLLTSDFERAMRQPRRDKKSP
ncbi:MAG: ribonuclease P protein component [Nitrospirae bacterium]|nr:ribonuclease P protein component [Nitrospirota bacterium]